MKRAARPQITKRQFIREWMATLKKSPADLMDALNVDKSQVYRWMKGQMPQPPMERRIAAYFGIDPEALRRHPDSDWVDRFFEGRDDDERDRIKKAMELAWPPKDTKH